MILPIRDSIPYIYKPWATWSLIALSIGSFILQNAAGSAAWADLFGYVPAEFLSMLRGGESASFTALTPLTSIFLHGGWWHLASNMWALWIFGDNVEDVMGHVRFVCFYLLCGLLAVAAHTLTNAGSAIPVVGASGAISGVLGAYFLLYPKAGVTTLVFFLILRIPASVYLGFWFVLQLVNGLTTDPGTAGVAWWAHLGGFAAGMILMPLFRVRRLLPPVLPPMPSVPLPQDITPPPVSGPQDPWERLRSR